MLNRHDIWDKKSPFLAKFGDIITNEPWNRPTHDVVEAFQDEWFSTSDISSFDIWLVGSFRESLERNISWNIWDVDYVINGDINKILQDVMRTGRKLGLQYKLFIDVVHFNVPPLDYTKYEGTQTEIIMTKTHKTFRKEMNNDYLEVTQNDAEKIDNLNLYRSKVMYPSEKQLMRLDDWYQYSPLKVHSRS